MKLKLNRENLKNKLAIVGKAYNPKASMPCFTGVLFENEHIVVANESVAIETEIISIDDEYINALIPFKTINDIVSKVKNEEIELVLNGNMLTINSGKSVYNINIMDYESYPKIEFFNENYSSFVSASQLKSIVSSVGFAASENAYKPILKGINFNYDNGVLNCVATDSFRLANYKLNCSSNFNFTIVAEDLINICNSIKDEDELLISTNGNSLSIMFGTTIYKTRLLDGTYPDVTRFLNGSYSIETQVNREEIIKALDLALIIAPSDEGQQVVSLDITPNEMTIKAKNTLVGESHETIKCMSNNDDNFHITFSGAFLLDALKSFTSENVLFSFNSSDKPFIITDFGNSSITQLILPIRTV